MSYTYAILEVSKATYEEIRAKLVDAEYHHAFHKDDGEVIDMHGIALRKGGERETINRTDSDLQTPRQRGR